MRKIQFANNEWYHIYNRGVDKRPIFGDDNDYKRFLADLRDFNNPSFYEERARVVKESGFKELSSFLDKLPRTVEIISYSLLPNHYHFILRQLEKNGISEFMHKLGTSYTNYFNKKYSRSGSLFQGPFKGIHLDNNEYFLWLTGYVNGNIEIHKIADAETYRWSSFRALLELENSEILGETSIISSQFKDLGELRNFVKKVIEESKKRKDLEKYLLESLQ